MTEPQGQILQIEGQEIVALSYPCAVHDEQAEHIKRQWAEAGLPGKLVVLSNGATISVLGRDEQLDRIESMLTTLVESLADEGEETEQRERTLDGEAVGGERDDSQPL
ncbi:hypothetical protein [Achromobacter xylosoxidans]|uniref:hypothetical protein n=1 Tax=Alcaligenes xylosoxydans xylosoxydans TaxID=85698 RepID=UPI001F133FF6|nr:hypothetical protein [Achromobacter xylosoxidans]